MVRIGSKSVSPSGDPSTLLYAFWTGNDRISRNRRKSLSMLSKRSGLDFILVTPETLNNYIVDNDPIHPAYQFLSSTHRSDYLRSYFMFHHGGGYSDIKPLNWDWRPYQQALASDSVDFYGSPEPGPSAIAGDDAMKSHYRSLVSNCAFLFHPGTQFAGTWKERVEIELDTHLEELRLHPGVYHPRAVTNGVHGAGRWDVTKWPIGYPLRWAQIQGEIFHQLQLEMPHSFKAALPRLNFNRYR